MEIVNLILVAILIGLTAFFVASEFAMVKIRSTRIDQLVAEGNKNAIAAKKIISNLDEYLSACQLGITVTALGLGWLGEPTVEHLLHPLFEKLNLDESLVSILSFTFAFVLITFLHVVVGELAPKTFAIQKAESITMLCARPLMFFYKVMYPFIWALNGSARAFTKLFGFKPASEHEVAHSEEELRIILSESYERGEINQSEFKYVNNIFEFDDRLAKEIMVPRTEIVSVSKDDTIEDFLKMAKHEKFTRYPVALEGDKDHIIGLVNIKEVLTDCIHGMDIKEKTIESYTKPIIQVIESIPIHNLLLKMQKERIHMAILMDEYGGTAGLVTVEDILEEIVGEIQDEFDIDEVPEVQKVQENHYIFDSKVLIDEVNDLLGTNIEEEDMDTIGGWMLTQNFDLEKGESVVFGGYEFKVLEREEHYIKRIEVFPTKVDPEVLQETEITS
ncbi:hemolysin family protein [Bacillus methanolicus]|uniref:hemolysin family protein n=1 Tax=Bacillus methanolicus TaxID=1471 RepID=UPI0023800578|nr:hemolysin family protein [Bacillus methanolicus]